MGNTIEGYRQINGSWGQLWWNGELICEVDTFEAKITPNREDVMLAGSLDVDSKITGLKGEGSFKIKKVYSRGVMKIVKAWRAGTDPRSQLIGKLSDPDTIRKQGERVVINNAWFNELTLMQFELGQKLEREFTFGFPVSGVEYPDEIKP